jgi:hypothetical protein
VTVAVAIPFYFCYDRERADVTRRLFRHYAWSVPDVLVIGVGSEGDVSREMFCEQFPESHYVEFEQDWDSVPAGGSPGLRRKFNAAVAATREYEPDLVFLAGSDDFMPPKFFAPSDSDLVGNAVGPNGGGGYFWEYEHRDLAYWWSGENRAHGHVLGPGPTGMSRKLLDELEWRPFQFSGDEYGVHRHVLEDNPSKFSVETRKWVHGWHPKVECVLNTLARVREAVHLDRVERDTIDEWLQYWDALGAS